ncbi:MAG: CDP-diacylglycerol--serine O-phosphatidyltransferase [Nannocystis sp.]|nr:CDP-diacylglycerol--serine O-phosphatidyltransferase [Nannocystis sp.]
MNLRRAAIIIPNSFTLASVFCGFYALSLCARLGVEGPESDALYKAAIAIAFGGFFDATDGRIARITKTQSEFGLQLDSLADVITFGVAPALLVYRWALEDLGRAGLFVAFLFLACGCIRLARFNVIATRDKGKAGKYTQGLPIPVAATTIVAVVIANHALGLPRPANVGLVAGMIAVLSYFMVSKIRFRSFKDLRPNRRTLAAAGLIAIGAVMVAAQINRPAVLIFLIACYLLLGLAEELLFLRQRLTGRATNSPMQGPTPPAPELTEAAVKE